MNLAEYGIALAQLPNKLLLEDMEQVVFTTWRESLLVTHADHRPLVYNKCEERWYSLNSVGYLHDCEI